MKNFLIIENFKKVDIYKNKLNLEELGMIYAIVNFDNNDLDALLNCLSIKIDTFKSIMQSLEAKKIVKLNVEIKNKEFVYWEITFINQEKEKSSDLEKLFILSDEQILKLSELKSKEEVFLNACKIYELTKEKYENKRVLEITTKEEYINYLNSVNPITLFSDLNVNINTKELYTLFEEICIKNKDKGMINLLIDYVVSTSVYNNFSLSFFNKVLKNWEENEIDDIQKAISYVKEAKEKINAKNTSNYEEPVWENVDQEKIEVEDVEKLLKEFGNK